MNNATIDVTSIEPDTGKGIQTVKITGEIDRDTINDFKEKMEKVMAEFTQNTMILDLEQLEFTNSEGIGYFTDVYNRLNMLSKRVFIVKASARILDIFQLVGLNQIIPCLANEDEVLNQSQN